MTFIKRSDALRMGGFLLFAIALPIPTKQSLANLPLDVAITTPDELSGVDRGVEAVVNYLEGTMSTVAQAASNPNFVGVQMTTCRITSPDAQSGSVYLYQEQALIEDLAAPYRQRVLQIIPGNNNRIDSRTFRPDTLEAWAGLCTRPEQPLFTSAALGEPVCTVSLRPSSVGGYVGSTPKGGCSANVRGAVSITNVVVLHEDGMDTWDRGFDAAGNQVWGAENVPYRYRR